MIIETVRFYIVCDNCNQDSDDRPWSYGYGVIHDSKEDAEEHLVDYDDGFIKDGRHYCWKCTEELADELGVFDDEKL